jgi:hypothetical protein
LSPLLKPISLKMRAGIIDDPRVVQCSEFCRAALSEFEEIRTNSGSDAVISHSDEATMFVVMRNGNRAGGPSVFWLHSLYDPPLGDLSKKQRRLLPSPSLLASAVMMADVVVTSKGILKDAREFEWPDRLKELQQALTTAAAQDRVLTVESMGCLPVVPKNGNQLSRRSTLKTLENLPSRYVLFPGRPTVDKGVGIFEGIAERLRAHNIACVAVRGPVKKKLKNPFRNGHVHWLPWLTQEELMIAMQNATCTVLPSITEGYGLAAAESINLGVATLYHQVGGHHALQPFPNAQRVPLTIGEREQLYRLWSELIATHPDSWSVWTRHENSLTPLIDKWVEAIRSVNQRSNGKTPPDLVGRPVAAEQWGNKLLRRIQNGH